MSATARSSEMNQGRDVIQRACHWREMLFTKEESLEFKGWLDNNRQFRALVEDLPPPKPKPVAPVPVEKKERKLKDDAPTSHGAEKGPGSKEKGQKKGKRDRRSITEQRVEETARNETEKLTSSQKEKSLDGRNEIIDDLLRYAYLFFL